MPYDARDPRTHGLLLRILPTGKRDWYYQVARGKRVRIGPYPLVSISMARAEPKRILQRLAAGEDPKPEWLRATVTAPRGASLKELSKAYATEFKALKRAQGFEPRSLETLNRVVRELGDVPAASIDVRKWMQQRLVKGNAAVSVNRKLDTLRSLFKWGITHGLVETNPCDGVKRLKKGNVTRERVRIPTPDDEARLRKHLSGYLLDAYTFARNTGIRKGELFRIRRNDIEDGVLHIRVSKSGKSRAIPLNAAAIDVLLTRLEKGLLFPHAIKRAWAKAQTAAAPYPFTWNESTRHAFVSELLRRGVAPFTVAKLAGHADLSMLNVYGHTLHDDMAAAVEKIA